ncbi:MAG: hypothetical protein JXR19_06600 [Bacteroidia bacterium]
MKTCLTLSAFLLLTLWSSAQNYQVKGKLIDPNSKPVGFASVGLAKSSDSTVLKFVISKEDGSFKFNSIKEGEYLLTIACFGFEVNYVPLTLDKNIEEWVISMTPSTVSIKELMVKAPKIPIILSGDTVVYNSSSFKTQNNASVEDLIKKMPGIQVNKDGTVSTEGQVVTKVLINGKEFFGGNVQAATKNLDADLVDKVELIDRKTDEDEFTGEDGNEREKVINLVLKEEHHKGYFGTIRAGYGTDSYHNLHGNMNFFNDETQLSIIGGSNNVNRRLYGWQEMNTLQSFEINPFNAPNRTTWWNGGITSYNGGGANLHLTPAKKMNIDVAYVLSNESVVSISDRNSEIYLSEGSLYSQRREEANGDKNNHQINAKMEWEPDTLNRFVFRNQLSKMQNQGLDLNRSLNRSIDELLVNSGVNQDAINEGNEKFASKLHWTRKSKNNKDNHFLASVYVGGSDLSNIYDSYFNTDTLLLPFPGNEDPLLKQKLNTKEFTLAFTTGYQHKISEKFTIRPGLNYLTSKYNHSFIWSQDESTVMGKSPVGEVQFQNIEYYAHLIFKIDSLTTLHFVPELNQNIENRLFTTDSNYQYDFNKTFFIPYMFLRSSKPHKYNFRFNITANVSKPQINQILPVIDNSNPYQTIVGNIELQNYMTYRNSWNYQRIFGLGKILSLRGWARFNVNPIVNHNQIDEGNYSVSNVFNLKHSLSAYYNVQMLWPIDKIKAQIGLDVEYGMGQSFFIRNEEELQIDNIDIGFGPNIQFNEFDYWSLSIDYVLTKNNGSIGETKNNAFLSHDIDAEIVISPSDRLEIASSLYWEIFGSNSRVGSASIAIWNAEISYFFDKNQRWSLGIRAYDILDQNQNLWRWWSGNRFIQSQSNAIQNYFMGTLTYKIRKAGAES